eukprot:1776311-Amphidinium_carterae.1
MSRIDALNEGAACLTTFLVFARVAPREGQKLGFHSLKPTMLFWAAKYRTDLWMCTRATTLFHAYGP